MKKIVLLSVFTLMLFFVAVAQQKPAAMSMEDIARLQSMSPAKLEKYKQEMIKNASAKAKQLLQQYGIKIDETRLPDFEVKPPVRDIKWVGSSESDSESGEWKVENVD